MPRFCPDDATHDLLELAASTGRPNGVPLPAELLDAARLAGEIEITDAEGAVIARHRVAPDGSEFGESLWRGTDSPRPFERLFLSGPDARAAHVPGERVVLVDRPLLAADVAALADERTPTLLLVPAGPSRAPANPAWSTLRSAVSAAEAHGNARVLALPVPPSPDLPSADVLAAFGVDRAERLAPVNAGHADDRGTVVFLTGLSGAGKSTVARAVRDAVVEASDLPVTLLDGDHVRRHLTAGLGFTPEDRETNVRRVGWVAAEIAHHGGLVLCSLIAPYAATRAEVRSLVESVGARFVLVHMATPLAECERRDRKGLYGRARAGELSDFTGISAPYEEPSDAEIVLDTTGLTVAAARDRVLDALLKAGA